jgi:CheY-like chemotaxis protein/two-component sensor histidine kinase
VLEAEPTLDPELLSFVGEIHRAGDHLLEMINDLLDLSRIESGKLSIAVETTRLRPVLDQSIKLLQAMLSDKQVSLHGASCDASVQLLADKTRLRQVLLNLLSNAIKYNRQGGRIDIELRPVPGERLQVRISDTGPGIPPEKIKRLFRPFERLGAELTSTDGVGIGLVLSKQLTELMGGTLGVESAPGQGSTFWIELPMAQGAAEVEATAAPAPQEHAAEKIRVLYVEDNAANLRVIVAMLRHRPDLQLLSATNGEHGLEMARGLQPDLILLDIHLPGMDGYEVLAALQSDAQTRDIPVVALSADAMPIDIETGLKAGFRRYLTKPVKFDELLEVLNEVKSSKLSG